MRGRLEREIRLLPHVLACQVTPDDIVVLIEPAADRAAATDAVAALVATHAAGLPVRILTAGPAGPSVPPPRTGQTVPARAAVGAMALAGMLALGVGLRAGAPPVGPGGPASPTVPRADGQIERGLGPFLRDPVAPGAGPTTDGGGLGIIPDLPRFEDGPQAGPDAPTTDVPPPGSTIDPPSIDPPDVSPPPDDPPVEPPTDEPPVTAPESACEVRRAGRSHVLQLRATADGTRIKGTLLEPRGLAIGRDERIAFDARPHSRIDGWLEAALRKAGCDLASGSALRAALGDGLRIVLVVPGSQDDDDRRPRGRRHAPDEVRADMRARPKARRRAVRAAGD